MNLHHSIRPHHHAFIWVIAGMITALAAISANLAETRLSINSKANLPLARAADSIGNPGAGLPSQPAEPAECVADEQQRDQEQSSGGATSRQANEQRHAQLDQELQALNQRMSDPNLSDADR